MPDALTDARPTEAEDARRGRMAVLARAPEAALEAALAALSPAPAWQVLRGPETGMVMVRGRMGGSGRAFNLGEMTVTRCAVRLGDGRIGHAYIAGRDGRRAELAAVLEATAQGAVPPSLAQALASMRAAQEAERDDRSRRAAATRVEFYGMVRMG
ncbi:phosphonate C-P lyase system protein PhnG [Elioraea rosea]|uniref:phosphonate C-P lyase system protein PhnG n=1 Tax=Elioraea rosea TaxID=2492390 RepID=UPI001EF6D1A7|nr:phosphonate C-P lyase system protein PhnG [Elioraea rosea]